MDDDVEDCSVCLISFDDTLRRPRTLPCGHTFCTPCINELKEQGAVTCPTCRVSHALPEAGQFPISYAVEGFIRKMRGAGLACVAPKAGKQRTAPAAVTQPAPKATAGLSKKTRSLLQEEEIKVLAAIRSCQEEQRQLADYLTTLGGWNGRQQQLQDELQTLVDQGKGALKAISSEESCVKGRQEEVRQREEALHAMLQELRTPSTRQEAYEVIEDAGHLLEEEEEEEEEEERAAVFPDVHVVTTVTRVAESSHAAAAATQTVLGSAGTAAAAGESSLPADTAAASSIADRLASLLAPTLTAEELLRLTQRARGLVKAGRVLAVQDVEGQTRHARISLESCQLHLYSLQATPLPPHALSLQMGEVVPAAPPCEVFLDLAWPGSAARRVVVSLPRDTSAGLQFVLLCSGQRGASYANTRLFSVGAEGEPGEWVEGGDYETNDGEGGAPVLPNSYYGDYWTSGKAGAVWQQWCDSVRNAQFGIMTRNCKPGNSYGSLYVNVFGQVVCGLKVVQEAAKHRPITEVTVVQCGVLLPRR